MWLVGDFLRFFRGKYRFRGVKIKGFVAICTSCGKFFSSKKWKKSRQNRKIGEFFKERVAICTKKVVKIWVLYV